MVINASGVEFKKKKREEKKEFAAARVAIISANRWTGNKLFLRVA